MKPTFENAEIIYELNPGNLPCSLESLKKQISIWTIDNRKLKMFTDGNVLRIDLKGALGSCITNTFMKDDSMKMEFDRLWATSVEEIIENYDKLLKVLIEREEIIEKQVKEQKNKLKTTLSKWNEREI